MTCVDGIAGNTAEWSRERMGADCLRLNASDAPVACGIAQYAHAFSLYDVMVARADQTEEQRMADIRARYSDEGRRELEECRPAMAHGHRFEPAVVRVYRALMTAHVASVTSPAGYYVDAYEPALFGATPDATVRLHAELRAGAGRDGLLECKAPYGPAYDVNAPVSELHMCQMQFAMHVTRTRWCDYIAAKFDAAADPSTASPVGTNATTLRRVHYSQTYADWMMPRARHFARCLRERRRPVLAEYPCGGASQPPSNAVVVEDLMAALYGGIDDDDYDPFSAAVS